MRPALALLAALALAAPAFVPADADAQQRRGQERGQERGGQRPPAEAAADRKKNDAEWNTPLARLPGSRNVGPCPYVKVLYDAHRYVEFAGGREASAAVGYTGEIEGISANCEYQAEDPISVDMNVGFSLGRGPQATGDSKTYTYWVAVTQRNRGVLAKEYFTVPVRFPAGQDRVVINERIAGITIPRANATTSGSNFEILVGFEVTPEMAAFNREGKRFRVNAAPVQAAAATPPATAAQ
jgi:hypothetical protein